MKPAVQEHAQRLASLRQQITDDDPRFRNADLDAVWIHAMLLQQDREYQRKLRICYAVIATLAATVTVLAWPT